MDIKGRFIQNSIILSVFPQLEFNLRLIPRSSPFSCFCLSSSSSPNLTLFPLFVLLVLSVNPYGSFLFLYHCKLDRFISNMSAMYMDYAHYMLTEGRKAKENSPSQSQY
ncbi:hypothetical protein SADUNF_Sadunf06G0156100 [Salix dunnii]|uniref:Uncharacterized protein n=1 Tax=Salix dunnii TaxID=1413687 RepID=A0A835K4W8_9ROSI|nr:hypothetical protein SADUNF_Sadunf06G0156100 [Salix dunnii]